MHKILDVTMPPITSFFHVDIPLTILYGDRSTYAWIYSNYIQMYSTKNVIDTRSCFIDFFHSYSGTFRFLELSSCPWIAFEKIMLRDILKKWNSGIEFVKEKINEDKYIGITVNSSHIKNYSFSMLHNLFIYGYDDKKELLYAADHFKNGIFSFEKIPFDEFTNSLCYPHENELNWGNLEGVWSFSKVKRTHDNIYNLSLKKIIYDLKCYTKMEGYIFKEDQQYVYGLDCYNNLIYYYNILKGNSEQCNLKGIFAELAHKKLMIGRINYLLENDYEIEKEVFDQYVEVFNILERCKNLSIKYNVNHNKDNLEKVIESLSKIRDSEGEFNKQLIDILIGLEEK